MTAAGIYHADPHRGNVLATDDGRLALLDFGLLGRLDDDTRRTLALLLMALAQNQADDVAQLILKLGHLADRLEKGTLKRRRPEPDLDQLDGVVRTLANRMGAAMIIVGLLVSSALMARVSTTIAIAGFVVSAIIALFEIWRIVRTPGDL